MDEIYCQMVATYTLFIYLLTKFEFEKSNVLLFIDIVELTLGVLANEQNSWVLFKCTMWTVV